MAALARVHLGRVLRALGRNDEARTVLDAATQWHRRAGGGEQALLGECLLAAIDAAETVPDAPRRLAEILQRAREVGDAPVEVFALDALARGAVRSGERSTAMALLADSDARMPAAAHFISDPRSCRRPRGHDDGSARSHDRANGDG